MTAAIAQVQIVKDRAPGVVARIAELHDTYYGRKWGFGAFFKMKVASELSSFLETYDEARDGLWTAMDDGTIVGAIAIDGSRAATDGAHLRLWTFEGLDAARHLYEKCGFVVVSQEKGSRWGREVIEQKMERLVSSGGGTSV